MNEAIETINHIVTVSNDTISNQIAAVNTLLVVFSIILALVGVVLGFYIAKLHNKVINIKNNIDDKERTIIKLATTVKETDKKIQSDLTGLYKKLQREESLSLLHRLEQEPLDVSNLLPVLLARDLDEEGFYPLKNAFLKYKNSEEKDTDILYYNKKEQYCLIFFQHYCHLSIVDDDLRNDITSDFEHVISCAFKRDIIKSTNELCKALSRNDVIFNKVDVLSSYLKAINKTQYKDSEEIKMILEENVNNRNILVEAIDRCTSDKCYLSMFNIDDPNESAEDVQSNFKGSDNEDTDDYGEDD